MAIGSLVFGILGLCMTLFSAGALGIIGLICGIAGIILAKLAQNNGTDRPKIAAVGLYLSIASAILGIVLFAACSACVAAVANIVGF